MEPWQLMHIVWAHHRRKILTIETILFQDLAFLLLKHIIWACLRQKLLKVETFLLSGSDISFIEAHVIWTCTATGEKFWRLNPFYSLTWHFLIYKNKIWAHHRQTNLRLKHLLFQDLTLFLLKHIILARGRWNFLTVETFLFQDLCIWQFLHKNT